MREHTGCDCTPSVAVPEAGHAPSDGSGVRMRHRFTQVSNRNSLPVLAVSGKRRQKRRTD